MSASPPLAPAHGGPLYFVLCDFGPAIGRAYNETDPEDADRETILNRLMSGEYSGPLQVLEVDLPKGTACDVSSQFAEDILQRAKLEDLPADVVRFVSLSAGLGAFAK